jgi:hypothetical protein
VRPTRIGSLVAVLVAVAAVSWGALRIMESRAMSLPTLRWTSPTGILLLALVVLVATFALRRRLEGRRPPNPLGVARMAVLGKASAFVGPLIGGMYLGYLIVLLPDVSVGDRGDRAWQCALAILAAVLLSAAGLFLERTCRIDDRDDELPPAVPGV